MLGLGGRFIYLSWRTRAKLLLDEVDPDVLSAAERSGRLAARLA